jgi:uncharacterized circularly permuted ATP-grasp superfamily protein
MTSVTSSSSSPGAAAGSQAQSQSLGGDSASAATEFQIQQTLSSLSAERLDRVFSMAEELHEEEGNYLSPRETAHEQARTSGGFDLMPLVIGGDEWLRIEAGLTQRVRAWNFFLRDIYSGQEILKESVVPYEIVYSDPNFHRGCARLPGVTASYLQLTAFDLQQDMRGDWLVVEDHLGVADGASYALKKRQILRQIAPRLFDGWEILPIEDFAAQVLDVLQELVRIPEGVARSVLLAQGSSDEYYLDDAALARQMGVPIVQGNDLVVLDSRLYLKTIAGIEPVDVILRRLATSLLDPVIFDPTSRFGVPGLLSCVRRGSLAVGNGLGSDLANNHALAGYLPVIMEYYMGEKPLLRSPHVLEMRDLDVREQIADSRDDYVISHVWKRGPTHEWTARQMSGHEWNRFWHEIEETPSEDARVLDAEGCPRAASDVARLCPRAGPGFALCAGLDGFVIVAAEFHGDNGPGQGCLDFAECSVDFSGGGACPGGGSAKAPALDEPGGRMSFLDGPLCRAGRDNHAHAAHYPDAGLAIDGKRHGAATPTALGGTRGGQWAPDRFLREAESRRDHGARGPILLPARPAQHGFGPFLPAGVSSKRREHPRTFSARSLVGAESSLPQDRGLCRPEFGRVIPHRARGSISSPGNSQPA